MGAERSYASSDRSSAHDRCGLFDRPRFVKRWPTPVRPPITGRRLFPWTDPRPPRAAVKARRHSKCAISRAILRLCRAAVNAAVRRVSLPGRASPIRCRGAVRCARARPARCPETAPTRQSARGGPSANRRPHRKRGRSAALALLLYVYLYVYMSCHVDVRLAAYTRSKMLAMPCPPPMHRLTSPYREPRRSISCISFTVRIAPVAPSG
jgi:hypothetical protein